MLLPKSILLLCIFSFGFSSNLISQEDSLDYYFGKGVNGVEKHLLSIEPIHFFPNNFKFQEISFMYERVLVKFFRAEVGLGLRKDSRIPFYDNESDPTQFGPILRLGIKFVKPNKDFDNIFGFHMGLTGNLYFQKYLSSDLLFSKSRFSREILLNFGTLVSFWRIEIKPFLAIGMGINSFVVKDEEQFENSNVPQKYMSFAYEAGLRLSYRF